MKPMKQSHKQHPALQQIHKNASSMIGHLSTGNIDFLAGQTFHCPEEGDLNNIQVYVDEVPQPGHLILTVHDFDEERKNWGNVLSQAELEIEKKDNNNWIRFNLNPVHLHKSQMYGFRLNSPDGFVALGEAVWTHKNAFDYGLEWKSNTKNHDDIFYQYFSLAFKVELNA